MWRKVFQVCRLENLSLLSYRISLYIICFNSTVPRSSSIMPYLFFFVCLLFLECGIDYNVQLVIHDLQIDLFAKYQSPRPLGRQAWMRSHKSSGAALVAFLTKFISNSVTSNIWTWTYITGAEEAPVHLKTQVAHCSITVNTLPYLTMWLSVYLTNLPQLEKSRPGQSAEIAHHPEVRNVRKTE